MVAEACALHSCATAAARAWVYQYSLRAPRNDGGAYLGVSLPTVKLSDRDGGGALLLPGSAAIMTTAAVPVVMSTASSTITAWPLGTSLTAIPHMYTCTGVLEYFPWLLIVLQHMDSFLSSSLVRTGKPKYGNTAEIVPPHRYVDLEPLGSRFRTTRSFLCAVTRTGHSPPAAPCGVPCHAAQLVRPCITASRTARLCTVVPSPCPRMTRCTRAITLHAQS